MTRLLPSVIVVVLGLVCLLSDPAHAGRRVALVIGNSAYVNAPPLPNPVSDVSAIADMFKPVGFDIVVPRHDLGQVEFKRALREFNISATGADIALVYYAGHGVELGGENYLVPVDAKLDREYDARDETVALDRIFEALDGATHLRLVILDACRDNPFARRMQRQMVQRSITAGLGAVEPTGSNTLVAYAAKAGSTAEDGQGTHSPYTVALLKHLPTPGVDVMIAFRRVHDEVYSATRGHQEPFLYGSLGGDDVFLVPPSPADSVDPEARIDYEHAREVGTIEAWNSFLAVHPAGLYAVLARAQIVKFQTGTQVATRHPVSPPAGASDRATTDEELAWEKVRASGDPASLREFIGRYSTSPLSLNAQHRLDLLEQSAWDQVKDTNNAASLSDFIARFPESRRIADARRRLEEVARHEREEEQKAKAAEAERRKVEQQAWERARKSDTPAALRDFIAKFRDSLYVAEAEQRANELELRATREREEAEQRAREVEHQRIEREAARQREEEEHKAKAAEAERQKIEQQAWDKAKKADTAVALRDFIFRFGSSTHVADAEQRASALEQAAVLERQQVEQRARDAERQKAEREAARQRDEEQRRAKEVELEWQRLEKQAWEKVSKTDDPGALTDFISRFPGSSHIADVRGRLDVVQEAQLQRAEREALRQREEEERKAKAVETEHQKMEQQAWDTARLSNNPTDLRDFISRFAASAHVPEAQQRLIALELVAAREREEAERRTREAERKRAERDAARQRDEAERRAKQVELERQKLESDAWDKAARGGDQASLRDFIVRFPNSIHIAGAQQRLGALQQAERQKSETLQQAALAVSVPAVEQSNTPELVQSMQQELRRIGCLAGDVDGQLTDRTLEALTRYREKRGKPTMDLSVTSALVADLKSQPVIEYCIVSAPSASQSAARHRGDKSDDRGSRKLDRADERGRDDHARRQREAPHERETREPHQESHEVTVAPATANGGGGTTGTSTSGGARGATFIGLQ